MLAASRGLRWRLGGYCVGGYGGIALTEPASLVLTSASSRSREGPTPTKFNPERSLVCTMSEVVAVFFFCSDFDFIVFFSFDSNNQFFCFHFHPYFFADNRSKVSSVDSTSAARIWLWIWIWLWWLGFSFVRFSLALAYI